MKADYFSRLVVELADEDPFALRGVLQILGIEFTDEVPRSPSPARSGRASWSTSSSSTSTAAPTTR